MLRQHAAQHRDQPICRTDKESFLPPTATALAYRFILCVAFNTIGSHSNTNCKHAPSRDRRRAGTTAMTPTNDHTPGSDSHVSLFTELQTQDVLGALIRAQFRIEARLQHVLEQHMRRAEELPPLNYQHKVRLAVAFGMQSGIAPALLLVGQLRDNAVKSLDGLLDDAAVDQLFGVLAKPEREAVLAWRTDTGSFRDVPSLQRFNIIAAALYTSLPQSQAAAAGSSEANEVVTFEWSAPAPAPRRARDFASKEALYSWLIVSD